MIIPGDPVQGECGVEFVRRFITIRAAHSNEEVDLEMPGNRPIAELMPDLLKALGWPVPERGDPPAYRLRTESGRALEGGDTLDSLGVENADVLWIGIAEADVPGSIAGEAQRAASGLGPDGESVPGLSAVPLSHGTAQDRRDSLSPPIPASFTTESPSLISHRGFVFELGPTPVLIGRSSRDSKPDIDLGEIDPEMASSRRHARVLSHADGYLLEALPTTNGTFINGRELEPGDSQLIKSGDRLQFGIEGVELVFLLGGETIPASFFAPAQR